jgi:hypothetical protein
MGMRRLITATLTAAPSVNWVTESIVDESFSLPRAIGFAQRDPQ